MDINELNWHVSYRSRMEARIKNKVAIAEVLNCRLKEDISFVKKHWWAGTRPTNKIWNAFVNIFSNICFIRTKFCAY